jgi:hypothetical protein
MGSDGNGQLDVCAPPVSAEACQRAKWRVGARHLRAGLASRSQGNVLGGNQGITDHTTRLSVHTGAVHRRPAPERAAAAARVRRDFGAAAGAFGEEALQSCQQSLAASFCGTEVRSARLPPQP